MTLTSKALFSSGMLASFGAGATSFYFGEGAIWRSDLEPVTISDRESYQGLSYLADSEAEQQLHDLASWTESGGEVAEALKNCESELHANDVFKPQFAAPATDSETFRKICDMTPPKRESLAQMDGQEPVCTFTKFTPCEIVFERSYQVSMSNAELRGGPVIEIRQRSRNLGGVLDLSQSLDDVPVVLGRVADHRGTALETGLTVIKCRPIAVLGLQPKWVCGAGYNYLWSASAKPGPYQGQPPGTDMATITRHQREGDSRDIKVSFQLDRREQASVGSSDFLREFLSLVQGGKQ
jgi:hypothetical protein